MTTNIISKTAAREGYDIKTSDVIGLSLRGGLIWGSVRFGMEVPSPLIPIGRVISFLLSNNFKHLGGSIW